MSNPLAYLGNVKAPTRTIATEVNNHLNSVGKPLPVYPEMKSSVMWGYNSGGAEHGTGRAIDFMIRNSPAVGDEVAEYLWVNRERFGLIHLIWQQSIRSTVTQPGVWRKMADRGSSTENHRDHVHAYFNGKAVSSSSGGAQSAPKPAKTKYYKPTGTSLSVKQIQGIVGTTADGYYGDNTKSAVAKYQRTLGVTADGLWGKDTDAAHRAKGSSKPAPKPAPKPAKKKLVEDGLMGRATTAELQRFLGVKVDSVRGPVTNRALQKWLGVKQDGVVGKRTVAALQRKVGARVDSIWGKETTRKLQQFLNEQ